MALPSLVQADFSAGGFQGPARHLIPENGLYGPPVNLLTDEDGNLYKRGGTEYQSNAGFGVGVGTFLWDGYLAGGRRTFFANAADFGVLAADDATPVNLGGAGMPAPLRAVELRGFLHVGLWNVLYGGSLKAADYSTGTVSVTAGSTAVTGVGTSWLANVDAGMFLLLVGGKPVPVASVETDTTLTLRHPYPSATAAGSAYELKRLTTPARGSAHYAVAANRLIAPLDSNVWFSDRNDPFTFGATSFHELPQGIAITGAHGIRDRVLIFTTGGLWTISNMAYDLTDAAGNVQHRVEHSQPNLILWSNEGIAPWQNGLLVPTVDGLQFVDGISAPVPFSVNIRGLWAEYVAAGYKTGLAAVWRDHYFLPILNSSDQVIDVLVCYLPRRAWSRFTGHAGNVSSFATRVGSTARQPVLLGAGPAGRILKVSPVFTPTAGRKADADGGAINWEFTTRDYQPAMNLCTFRKVRIGYELVDAGSDNPTIGADYDAGDGAVSFLTSAPEGTTTFTWSFVQPEKSRFVRFRIGGTTPSASFKLRSLEVMFRPSGKP